MDSTNYYWLNSLYLDFDSPLPLFPNNGNASSAPPNFQSSAALRPQPGPYVVPRGLYPNPPAHAQQSSEPPPPGVEPPPQNQNNNTGYPYPQCDEGNQRPPLPPPIPPPPPPPPTNDYKSRWSSQLPELPPVDDLDKIKAHLDKLCIPRNNFEMQRAYAMFRVAFDTFLTMRDPSSIFPFLVMNTLVCAHEPVWAKEIADLISSKLLRGEIRPCFPCLKMRGLWLVGELFRKEYDDYIEDFRRILDIRGFLESFLSKYLSQIRKQYLDELEALYFFLVTSLPRDLGTWIREFCQKNRKDYGAASRWMNTSCGHFYSTSSALTRKLPGSVIGPENNVRKCADVFAKCILSVSDPRRTSLERLGIPLNESYGTWGADAHIQPKRRIGTRQDIVESARQGIVEPASHSRQGILEVARHSRQGIVDPASRNINRERPIEVIDLSQLPDEVSKPAPSKPKLMMVVPPRPATPLPSLGELATVVRPSKPSSIGFPRGAILFKEAASNSNAGFSAPVTPISLQNEQDKKLLESLQDQLSYLLEKLLEAPPDPVVSRIVDEIFNLIKSYAYKSQISEELCKMLVNRTENWQEPNRSIRLLWVVADIYKKRSDALRCVLEYLNSSRVSQLFAFLLLKITVEAHQEMKEIFRYWKIVMNHVTISQILKAIKELQQNSKSKFHWLFHHEDEDTLSIRGVHEFYATAKERALVAINTLETFPERVVSKTRIAHPKASSFAIGRYKGSSTTKNNNALDCGNVKQIISGDALRVPFPLAQDTLAKKRKINEGSAEATTTEGVFSEFYTLKYPSPPQEATAKEGTTQPQNGSKPSICKPGKELCSKSSPAVVPGKGKCVSGSDADVVNGGIGRDHDAKVSYLRRGFTTDDLVHAILHDTVKGWDIVPGKNGKLRVKLVRN